VTRTTVEYRERMIGGKGETMKVKKEWINVAWLGAILRKTILELARRK
jgi:hypothetical protein